VEFIKVQAKKIAVAKCLLISVIDVIISQPAAFPCWSSRTSTGPTSSTVRGRSTKSGSTTQAATTDSATNDLLSQLTVSGGRYKLRFDLQSRNTSRWYYAEYSTFRVRPEAYNYELTAAGYVGNAATMHYE